MGFDPVAYKDVFLRRLVAVFRLILSLIGPGPAHDPARAQPTPTSALTMIRDHLPVTRYTAAVGAAEAEEEACSVCLCEFEEAEEVRRLRKCRHVFHRGCLDRWIDLDHRSCPLCRTHLLSDDLLEEFNLRLAFTDQYYYFPDYDDDYD